MAFMAVLETDLRALSVEARRKFPAVKDAAEHAILKLRSLSNPSEIAHNEDILRIFLMACEVRSVKLSVIGLSCLQKLISHNAVAPSALKEILSTLKEHAEMADESVQLKTLQTILIIFQSHLHPENEDNAAKALGICLRLLENNRSSDSVRNTAAATFRQAVALIFDHVVSAESLPSGKMGSGNQITRTSSVTDDVSRSINRSVSLESEFISGGPSSMRAGLTKTGKLGLRLLEDLTALAAGGSAVWLRVTCLQRTFALDILEFILSNYVAVFRTLASYEQVLRYQICSLLMTSLRTNAELEGEAGEPSFRRLVLRSVAHVIRLYSLSLVTECEVFLSMLVKVTSIDLPLWHRILVLEVLRGFCVEVRTLRLLFQNFDMHPKNTNVVESMVKALARVVSSVQVPDSSEESLAAVAGMFSSKAKGIEWSLDNDASNAAVVVASEAHAITLAVEGLLGVVFTVATLTDEAVDVGEIESPRCVTDPPAKCMGETAALCISMVDSMWLTILDALSLILTRSQGEAIILEILKGYQAFTQACGVLRAVEPLNSFLASLCKFTISFPSEAEKRRDSYSAYGFESANEVERSRRLQIFRPAYELLVSLVSFRVQYPQDYQDLSKEDLKDFKQTRYAIEDVLMDAALVLGGDSTLRILFMKLVQAVGNCRNDTVCEWRHAEAALFCIWAIAKSVSVAEAEVLPQVMALLPKLPNQPQLLQTACLTIGAYSTWLNTAPTELSILASIIETLTRGMSTSEDSAAAAALAFRHVCADCRKKLCGSVDGLFHIYHLGVTGEGGYKLAAEDSLHLVEALSMVITELPPDHANKALEMLCLPAVTSLQDIIHQGSGSLQQVVARQLTIHIDRLATIFRYVNHPAAVADATQRLWPMFKAIFDHRAWDIRTMESLCRACKYAVRTSGRLMGITIGAMLEEVQGLYKQHHQPCFLYLSSEVVKIFGSDQSCASYLGSLIEALFSQTTHLLTTIQDFTARPDIADDCFLLASRCIRYCPHIFVLSSIFPSLVDCSMIGITIQHRDACNSILTFLSDVLDISKSHGNEQYRAVIDGVFIPRGPSLTRILIASLTGALPSSRQEEVTYVLLALTKRYGIKVLEWAKGCVSLIPSTAVTEAERASFLNALMEAASGSGISAFKESIKELSEVCRRNRSVHEIVQGALRPRDLNFAIVSS